MNSSQYECFEHGVFFGVTRDPEELVWCPICLREDVDRLEKLIAGVQDYLGEYGWEDCMAHMRGVRFSGSCLHGDRARDVIAEVLERPRKSGGKAGG